MANVTVLRGQTKSICDNSHFGLVFLPISYGMIFLLSVAGNIFLLLHYVMKKKSSSKLFMVNLAALDLLMALTLPLMVAYRSQGSDWHFGENLCIMCMVLFYGNLYGGNLFMLCICLDRFVAVCFPMAYRNWKQNSLRWLLCPAVWIIIFAFGLWGSSSVKFLNPQPDGTNTCGDYFSDKQWHSQLGLLLETGTVIFFFLPYVTIVITYTLIARRLKTSRGEGQKLKSLKAIFILITIMTICFLPFHLLQMVNVGYRLNTSQGEARSHGICVGLRVVALLASLNSMLDPFIYYFYSYDVKLNLLCNCTQRDG